MNSKIKEIIAKTSKSVDAWAIIVLSSLISCGSSSAMNRGARGNTTTADARSSPPNEDTDKIGFADDAVKPPQAYYDALLADRMLALDAGALNLQTQQVLWINFNGATVPKGYSRGQSFIACKSEVTIPPAPYSTSEQTQILQLVAQYYSNAGVSLAITFEKPQSGDYTTIHVGGNYSDLGCGSSSSTLGIAPYDVGNADPNDIGFAFIPGSNDITTQALTIAHESAHTFGLDHTGNNVDIMYPMVSREETAFTVGVAEGSHQNQDGPAMLQKDVGAGVASVSGSPVQAAGPTPAPSPSVPISPKTPNTPSSPPGIANLPGMPALGGLGQILGQLTPTLISSLGPMLPMIGSLPGGTSLSSPTAILSALTLFKNGVAQQNGGVFDLSKVLGTLSSGSSSNFATGILSTLGLSGNGGTANNVSSLIPIAIPGVGSPSSSTSQPCDVAALLGLNAANPAQLISMIPMYAQSIHTNAPASQAPALVDAVKLAIAQKYAGMIP